MSDRQPWQRLPNEPKQAFHAFCHWRDQASHERSGARAYTAHRLKCKPRAGDPVSPPANHWDLPKQWKEWKRVFKWEARADAHDVEVAEIERVARVEAIKQMNVRHATIAAGITNKIIERLMTIDSQKLSFGQLVHALEKATVVERRARGQATDIVKHQDATDPVDLSGLTEDELAHVEALLTKASETAGAAPSVIQHKLPSGVAAGGANE